MKFGKAKARPKADTNVSADVPQKPKDPYVLAREEWIDRYGDYIASAKNWRSVAVITSLVALVSVGGLAYVGAQDKVFRKPSVVFISAGNDGSGALRAIERIALGYKFKTVFAPVIARGNITEEVLDQCRELGGTLAGGCAMGIY